jgi:multiple sugar transport system ATP-binding protein
VAASHRDGVGGKRFHVAELSFDSVGKVYSGSTRALSDFSLDVGDGELMVFVGPSGCGKTTALRMVAGLEEITEGEIRIGDRVVNDIEPRERDVAMVFQNYALYPHMSVYENIAFGLRMRHVAKKEIDRRVRQIAQVVGLADLLKRKPRELSGGQRQRVAMGRAIVRDPAVFLMDEPLSNLDARLRVQMRAEIARIQDELGTTTIYVTHDQVEAMTMGDRVCVLRKGELQQTDAPQQLYDAPTNLFVASFIGSPEMNLLEATLVHRDDEFVVQIGEQELPVPKVLVAARPALAGYVGKAIAVGIRPEHVDDAALSGADGRPRLVGRAVLMEALGSERLVHMEIAAPPVVTEEVIEVARDTDATFAEELESEARSKKMQFVGRFDAASRVKAHENVEIAVTAEKVHFFDLETGLAI